MSRDTATRREFLRNSAMGTAALAATSVLAQNSSKNKVEAAAKQRNIVFIFIDDLRFDALGILGHPFVETPHLDALARNGVIADNAYVTTSLCSPSRATVLSGQYAHRHGVLDNNTELPDGTPTFPEALQKAGYDTAFIGKKHMGGSDAPQPGFNRWISFPGQGVYNNPVFNIDGEKVPHEGYITDLLTDYAVDFINQPRNAPFMLYLSHKAVHAEFMPAPRHKGRYADKQYPYPESMANTEENYRSKPEWVRKQRESWHGVDGMYNHKADDSQYAHDFDSFTRNYAETILAIDDGVGRIVETLREKGILDSTLFVFTSDNGFMFGEHGLIDKRTMYEASVRVPLIVHCPELFAPGQHSKALITNLDYAPTFVAAAGLDVPDTMQGLSFLEVLQNPQAPWRDAFLYEYFWERSFPQTPTVLGVRTQQHKFMRYHGIWDRYELYDMDADPDERNNLLGDYLQKHEAGTLEWYIRRNAPPALRDLFISMDSTLNRLLEETGALAEPSWRALT